MGVDFEHIFQHVLPALESKRMEFSLYDYNSVTEEDIWSYLIKKKWKKRDVNEIPLHEIVKDILETSPSAFMTQVQMEEYKSANWFSDMNNEDLQGLFKPKKANKE